MCRREQRRCLERGVRRDDFRFAAPEVVEHRGDLSAHCSNVGIAPGVTGSDAPCPAVKR